MTLYNPFFKFLNPRNSGLITFKGGGGGATEAEVETTGADNSFIEEAGSVLLGSGSGSGASGADTGSSTVDTGLMMFEGGSGTGASGADTGSSIVDTGNTASDNIGTASPTGTVISSEDSFVSPIVESTDAEGNVSSTGGDTITYGGNEVEVTGTVKGDTETILGNQSNTDELINTRFDTFQPTTVVTNTIDTSDLAKSGAMEEGFKGVTDNQGVLLGNQGSILGGQVVLSKGQTDILGNQNTMQTGIDKANTGITGLGSAVGNVQTGVDAVNTGITELGTTVGEGFASTDQKITDMQTAVLTGQASMSDVLNAMKEEATTYYGDLSAGQTAIQDSVGGVQTGLDTLRTDQQKANTLADQQRAELAKSVTGGFDQVTTNQRDIQDQATRISDKALANQGDIQRNQNTIMSETGTFANTAKALSGNQQNTSQSASFEKLDFVDRLNTIKNILLNSGDTLDESVRTEYSALANAFDDQGSLITDSVDKNRNPVRRGINQQGMLITNTYNPSTGQLVDQKNTDINQLMAALDTMGYRTLGSQTGDLSSQGMGLMSSNQDEPFIKQNL